MYIHVDDGIGHESGKKEAQEASNKVKEDLKALGVVVSEEKCMWKVGQVVEWTGLI